MYCISVAILLRSNASLLGHICARRQQLRGQKSQEAVNFLHRGIAIPQRCSGTINGMILATPLVPWQQQHRGVLWWRANWRILPLPFHHVFFSKLCICISASISRQVNEIWSVCLSQALHFHSFIPSVCVLFLLPQVTPASRWKSRSARLFGIVTRALQDQVFWVWWLHDFPRHPHPTKHVAPMGSGVGN